MRYQEVCLESLGYVLPDEVVTSDEIERRLAPVYDRLRLPAGRLELMSGIRERRFWAPGVWPSEKSVVSAERALEAAEFDRGRIGALVHASVCRDFLEPATACGVHHQLGLPAACQIYDLSNACLGLLNGVLQVANQIELGQIEAGLVVGTESSRALVETTIETLNRRESLTRDEMKLAIASLTIGSGSCAILLTHRRLSRSGSRLTTAVARTDTSHHALCRSGRDEAAGEGMQPLMTTDSERLLQAGVALGAATFADFLAESGWQRSQIARTFCHQVGAAHRRLMLDALGLDPARDEATYPWLGNTGSAALPLALALGARRGLLQTGDDVALLGIGSGVNCLMLGLHWGCSRVSGDDLASTSAGEPAETRVPAAAPPAAPLAPLA